MKKLLGLVLALTLGMSVLAYAQTKDVYNSDEFARCTTGEFDGSVAVTDTNTQLIFAKDTKALFVKNRGTDEVYVDPRDGIAVASDDDGGILILANESRDLSSFQTHKLGLIASTAESTTVQVDVCY